MNTCAQEAVNVLRDYGFRIPDAIIDNLYRVLKTSGSDLCGHAKRNRAQGWPISWR